MIYLQLLISFFKIGLFSFGGGYAAIPLIQSEVFAHSWLNATEFNDLITISQMTPGPIAINSATFIGTKVAGTMGALVATVGNVLPSCIIVTTIAYFYMKYRNLDALQNVLKALRPAVVALIFTAGVSILTSAFFPEGYAIKIQAVLIFGICLVLIMKFKMNPILVMVLSGLLNVVSTLLTGGF